MEIQTIKNNAREQLGKQSYPPRRLALIHAGLIALALLAVIGVNYYVNQKMNSVTGLSGMGMLSVLETVQAVLGYAINILQPFWQMGFVFAAVGIARGVQVRFASLTEGFRRFGPILRLMLLQGVVYGVLAFAGVYIGTVIYMVTPLATPLVELLMPIAEAGETMLEMQEMMLQLPTESVVQAMMPAFLIVIPVCLLIMLPVYYRFRLADLIVMDKPGTGALAALMLSSALSRKKRLALLRLDLSFWWYYALQLLASVLCMADVVLVLMGVEAGGISFGCYLLGLAVQVAVFWLAGSYFHTAWAVAYDTLLQQPVQMPKPKSAQNPQKLPWDDYNMDN